MFGKYADVILVTLLWYYCTRYYQVTLISGGGSGHEPAHAGFVGKGMLSGAVLGGMFASPSVAAILACIRTCTTKNGPGCLLIVKNYTGDRLNFGVALEQARSEGLAVRMVVVADDCALPRDKGITGRRGVAGTVFVHKVAGAAAEAGLSLEEVYCEATATAAAVGTLGVALSTCTLPGQPVSDRLSGNKIEIGLGIHGEPGMKQSECLPADAMVDAMISAITKDQAPPYVPLTSSDSVCLLVNNLGGTPTMELYICARRAIESLEAEGVRVVRVFVGPFMTSLEMYGVSISILKVDSELRLARLDAPTSAPAWLSAQPRRTDVARVPLAVPTGSAVAATSNGAEPAGLPLDPDMVRSILASATSAIVAAEPSLTAWDRIAGDGDCGITMTRGANAVNTALPDLVKATGSRLLLNNIAGLVSNSMGGTSGVLFEIGLRAAATASATEHATWGTTFRAFADAIKFYGGADRGYRTMLDVCALACRRPLLAKQLAYHHDNRLLCMCCSRLEDSSNLVTFACS
eukprot:m.413150 g.413150  ORF g.413150 m.413150 type:complete len:520 (-) comp21263_c0_seq5:497-2056(-)